MNERKIINCPSNLIRKPCLRGWDNLSETGSEAVRFCSTCNKNVHFCDSYEDAVKHAEKQECVAVPSFHPLDHPVVGLPRDDFDVGLLRPFAEPVEEPPEVIERREKRRKQQQKIDRIKEKRSLIYLLTQHRYLHSQPLDELYPIVYLAKERGIQIRNSSTSDREWNKYNIYTAFAASLRSEVELLEVWTIPDTDQEANIYSLMLADLRNRGLSDILLVVYRDLHLPLEKFSQTMDAVYPNTLQINYLVPVSESDGQCRENAALFHSLPSRIYKAVHHVNNIRKASRITQQRLRDLEYQQGKLSDDYLAEKMYTLIKRASYNRKPIEEWDATLSDFSLLLPDRLADR